MWNSLCHHMETSVHVSALRNLIQPLLVILKEAEVVVKAKPVLPHMDHHAHSSSHESLLSESVYSPAISSLSACQQPTGQAETHCSPGHLSRIAFPPHPLWLGVVLFSFCLSEWAVFPGYIGVSRKLPTLYCRLCAGPLVWTYHPLVLRSYLKPSTLVLSNQMAHAYILQWAFIPMKLSNSISR